MGKFEHWNRQQKRKFEKLDNDTKAEMLTACIMEKIAPVYNKTIAQSMILGIKLERKEIYDKYVNKIDSQEYGSKEWLNEVEQLLSYFRVHYLEMEIEKNKENRETENN